VQFVIPYFVNNYTQLAGRYILLEPLDPAKHTDALWQSLGGEANETLWLWMPDGPYAERAAFDAHMRAKAVSEDPLYFAIVDRVAGLAVGRATLMRIVPEHRVIEVGGIIYGPALQRSRGATEAMYLMARYVFEVLGYRRYEWKCNALN
jgi:RimJ/RimL family protein N-acetyltransferase